MKRLISGLSLAAALAGVLTVTGAPMATGALTVAPVALTSSAAIPATAKSSAVHGTVTNETDLTIKVATGWCESKCGPCGDSEIKELKPNKSTDGWEKDIDGYHVPPATSSRSNTTGLSARIPSGSAKAGKRSPMIPSRASRSTPTN